MKLVFTHLLVVIAAFAFAQDPFNGEIYSVTIEAQDESGNKQVLKQVTNIDSYETLEKMFTGSSIVNEFSNELMADVKQNFKPGNAYMVALNEDGKSVQVEITEGKAIADRGDRKERIIVKRKGNGLNDEEIVEERIIRMPRGRRNAFAIAGQNDRETAFLGVSVGAFNWKEADKNHPKGVKVISVVEGEAAFNAGIEAGDVITAVGDVKTPSPSLFTKTIRDLEPGTEVDITYYRAGKKITEKTTLGVNTGFNMELDMKDFDLEQVLDFENLGNSFQFEALPELDIITNMEGMGSRVQLGILGEDTDNGVVILEVVEGSAAEEVDLREGDVVTEFDGKKVENMAQLVELVQAKEVGEEVQVKVKRDGKTVKETVTLQKGSAFLWMDNNGSEFEFPGGMMEFEFDGEHPMMMLDNLEQFISPEKLQELEQRIKELELKLEQKLEDSGLNKS